MTPRRGGRCCHVTSPAPARCDGGYGWSAGRVLRSRPLRVSRLQPLVVVVNLGYLDAFSDRQDQFNVRWGWYGIPSTVPGAARPHGSPGEPSTEPPRVHCPALPPGWRVVVPSGGRCDARPPADRPLVLMGVVLAGTAGIWERFAGSYLVRGPAQRRASRRRWTIRGVIPCRITMSASRGLSPGLPRRGAPHRGGHRGAARISPGRRGRRWTGH
jgi:hypothetical protein